MPLWPRRVEWQPALLAGPSMSVRASTSARQSGHVDGELRPTAQAPSSPRHRLPTLRRRRRQVRPQQPAAAHASTAKRTTSSVPDANFSQRTTSPASSAQRSDSICPRNAPLDWRAFAGGSGTTRRRDLRGATVGRVRPSPPVFWHTDACVR